MALLHINKTKIWAKVFFVLALLMCILLMASVFTGSDRGVISAFGFFPLIVIAGYLALSGDGEIFHPLIFVFGSLMFGVTAQLYFLFFIDEGVSRISIGSVTSEVGLSVALLAICLGVSFLVIGFGVGRPLQGIKKLRVKSVNLWNKKKLDFFALLFFIIGCSSFVYFLSIFDVVENLSTDLSIKRRILDIETDTFDTKTWVRFGFVFSQISFYITYVQYPESKSETSWFLKLIMILSAVISVAAPFLSSSRSGVIVFLLTAGMLHHFSTGGWGIKRLQSALLVVLLVLVSMWGLRTYIFDDSINSGFVNKPVISDAIAPIFGSSNFLSIGKTSVVLEGVPSVMSYRYGQTYLLWMVAPMPRSIWSNKPAVRIG